MAANSTLKQLCNGSSHKAMKSHGKIMHVGVGQQWAKFIQSYKTEPNFDILGQSVT